MNPDFKADKIDKKWGTDFTYLFLTNSSKRYNCTIIEINDRSIIASITDKNITDDLGKRTLEKAIHSQPEIDLRYIQTKEVSTCQKSSQNSVKISVSFRE